MARSEHLPIYKASYDLCLHLEHGVAGFSRQHRYGIGADMRAASRRVLRGVVRANSAGDKAPQLRELRLEIEELKVLCRLAGDLKAFTSLRAFEHAVTRVVEIAKQNEGWLKSQSQRGSPDPSQGQGRNRSAMPQGLAGPGVPGSRGPPSASQEANAKAP
jgi:hypothetical protein